eukprot:TRINITY_DN11985_c0_g2_i3.p1 TRINITY_DN11985_c0_g2~~TRINITY_DN11985_c0_g2_i3.p1  ORF type:complete len:566 (+),score=45.68 TRINITY_DN11985_c0_g2_i3:55-1752(+)
MRLPSRFFQCGIVRCRRQWESLQSRTTPQEWRSSRAVDVDAFLDIACSTHVHREEQVSSFSLGAKDQPSSPANDAVPAPAMQAPAVQGVEARMPTKDDDPQNLSAGTSSAVEGPANAPSVFTTFSLFMIHVVVYSLILPFIFTFAVIPLLFQETPYEIWEAYYWILVCGTALYFSEHSARRCLGFDMKSCLMGLACLVCVSISIVLPFTSDRHSLMHGLLNVASVMFALYAPVVSRFAACIRKRIQFAPLLWYVAFMTWGASPSAISVVLYYGLVALEWRDDIWMVVVSVAVWSAASFFVKAAGWNLAYRGSPKAKFIGPLLWILYCDLAFGTLGLPLFMHSPRASLTYAASILPILLLHMGRGIGWFSWCGFCNRRVRSAAEMRVTKVNALLEALCAVQGRAVAYTVYFTMMALNAVLNDGGHPSTRRSIVFVEKDVFVSSVNIFRHTSTAALDMVAALLGFIATWLSFFLFCWVLPYAWALSARVAPADMNEASSSVDSTIRDAGNGGWILGGGRDETLYQQQKVILSFFESCRQNVITSYVFQLAITIAVVNMSEWIIFAHA